MAEVPLKHPLDYARVRRIVERFSTLDSYQAYYVKDKVRMDYIGPLVPETQHILRRAFSASRRVLDVGCGDGRTLLSSADLFGHGTGVDESADCMIAAAIRARGTKSIRNVDFRTAKAVNLPFDEGAFDMVFTERGPLGGCDETLVEALRVLQTRGLIFVETFGDFEALAKEKERFERHGVSVQTLVSSRQTLVFADFYEYLTYRCSVWTYCGEALPSLDGTEFFEEMLLEATDGNGRICMAHDTIWIGGFKAAEQ